LLGLCALALRKMVPVTVVVMGPTAVLT